MLNYGSSKKVQNSDCSHYFLFFIGKLQGKLRRSKWSGPAPVWWPAHIQFAPPKSLVDGKVVHNSDTLGHVLLSFCHYQVCLTFSE